MRRLRSDDDDIWERKSRSCSLHVRALWRIKDGRRGQLKCGQMSMEKLM